MSVLKAAVNVNKTISGSADKIQILLIIFPGFVIEYKKRISSATGKDLGLTSLSPLAQCSVLNLRSSHTLVGRFKYICFRCLVNICLL